MGSKAADIITIITECSAKGWAQKALKLVACTCAWEHSSQQPMCISAKRMENEHARTAQALVSFLPYMHPAQSVVP
eukprot:1133813-Pelagomonas_calceolata.AAC.1